MEQGTSRRQFLKTAAAGTAMAGLPAASYARVVGANERINLGLIGCGQRGIGTHMKTVAKHAKRENVTFIAVSDPWRQHREQAVVKARKDFATEAKGFVSHRELLQVKDLDAVMIASCDHQHTTHLKDAANAGMDVYVEKPLAMDLEKLKAAHDACKRKNTIVQIGTQQRSYPTNTGTRKVYRTGILGTVSRIEQHRNMTKPYWYGHIDAKVKESDVDWKEFLMDVPMQPFDPVKFSAWYGHREFSDGPVGGFGSHYIDLVHYITGAKVPTSCVCLGGTFTWKDKHNFTCPDHVQALWVYPEGFMSTFLSNFGNSFGGSFKIYGDVGTIDLVGAHAHTHYLSAEGGSKNRGSIRGRKEIEKVERPDHWADWLQCLRTRKPCNAPIEAGYQHAVACIMARQSYDTGRRMVYNPDKREIVPG